MITRLLSTCNPKRIGVFVALMSMFFAFSVMDMGTVSANQPNIQMPANISTPGCGYGQICATTSITITVTDNDLPLQNENIKNINMLENFQLVSSTLVSSGVTEFVYSFRAEATQRGAGWNGGSFEFEVQDNFGQHNQRNAEVDINSAPVATAVNTSGRINQPVVITLTGTDGDGDKFCCKQSVSSLLDWDAEVNNNGDDNQPYIDTLTNPTDGSISEISKVDDYTASVTYTPNNDFSGQDSFVFIEWDCGRRKRQ